MNSKEIARLAGVSRTTVSRVINNSPNVLPETREKVLAVIKENNYVPIEYARMMTGKVNKIIGLFIIDIQYENPEARVSNSTYFSQFIDCVIDRSNKFGYNILISIVSTVKDFKNVRNLFLSKTVSGGIFIGSKKDDEHIKELIDFKFKIVAIDHENLGNNIDNKCITINLDNIGGAYKATKYLVNLGHTKIAHITGDLEKLSGALRLEGYKKALSDSGIKSISSLIVKGDFSEEGGYKAAKKLLQKNKPTAIFVGNDTMAIGAMKVIKEMGLKIPHDISLIGFDDVEIAKYITPSLTTMKTSMRHMANISVENLINILENDLLFDANYTIPVELVERDSCKQL